RSGPGNLVVARSALRLVGRGASAAAAMAPVGCGHAGRDGFTRFCAAPPHGANDFRHIPAMRRASAQRPGGIDHVLAVEARRGRAVRDRRDLARLALAVEERATEAVVAGVADRRAGVPELRRADLVRGVLHQPLHLAIADADLGGPQPSDRAVLITFWPSKRAVAAPCETAETWLGWPLPSKNEPPRR